MGAEGVTVEHQADHQAGRRRELARPKRAVPAGSVLGLQPEAMVVYRAVMERWAVKSVGGYRATSLSVHQFGRAIDFMTFSNHSQGYAIRDFLVAHAKEFGIDHIIYMQQI